MTGRGNKHNWKKLKIEYTHGKYKNLKEFAKIKGIPYNSIAKRGKEWKLYDNKLAIKTEEKTIEAVSDRLAKANVKQLGRLEEIQRDGMSMANSLKAETWGEAVSGTIKAMDMERQIIAPKGEDKQVTIIMQSFSMGYKVDPKTGKGIIEAKAEPV